MPQKHPRRGNRERNLRLTPIPGRLTADEIQMLRQEHGDQLAEYCRQAVLKKHLQLPAPATNRLAYLELGKIRSLLFQLVQKTQVNTLNSVDSMEIQTLMLELKQLQGKLLGIRSDDCKAD